MYLNNKQKRCRSMCFVDVVVVQLSHQDEVLGVNVLKKQRYVQICTRHSHHIDISTSCLHEYQLTFTSVGGREGSVVRWGGCRDRHCSLRPSKLFIFNETSQYIQPRSWGQNRLFWTRPPDGFIIEVRKTTFLMGSLDVSSCVCEHIFSYLNPNKTLTQCCQELTVGSLCFSIRFVEMYITNINPCDWVQTEAGQF